MHSPISLSSSHTDDETGQRDGGDSQRAAGGQVGRPLVLDAPGGYSMQLPRRLIAATTAVAAGAILAMLADTMIPEAFEGSPHFSGLITVAGFLAAFMLSNYQEPVMLARPRRSRVTWRSWPR